MAIQSRNELRQLSSQHEPALEDCFQGWQNYPSNLLDFCPLVEDDIRYRERLQQLSSLLFSEKSVVQVVDAQGMDGSLPV
jgi:hypothetical protein